MSLLRTQLNFFLFRRRGENDVISRDILLLFEFYMQIQLSHCSVENVRILINTYDGISKKFLKSKKSNFGCKEVLGLDYNT